MLYRISRFFAWCIFKLYFRLKIIGSENIPAEGPCIIVANHASLLDPLLICTMTPRIIHYITYAYFFYHWSLHWYLKRTYCIPLKKEGNDIAAFKVALRLLKKGECLGIFPEGERSATGKMGKGTSGTALIASRARVPILPVGIQGAYEAFPRQAKFPKPTPITLTFGKPFFIEQHLEVDKNNPDELQEKSTDLIMLQIAKLCAQESFLTGKTQELIK